MKPNKATNIISIHAYLMTL